jgi:surfactin synthase thioesterase subunit
MLPMSSPENWFVGGRPCGPGLVLLCFPHAGGGGYVYRPWFDRQDLGFTVVGVQPPGRQDRLAEPPHTRMSVLADEAAEAVAASAPGRFAFFGHSLGGLLAYEVARRLRLSGHANLAHLFVSGTSGPRVRVLKRDQEYHTLQDGDLLSQLREWGGVPDEVFGHPGLLDIFLSTVRPDLEVVDTYEYPGSANLACPITVYAGANDDYGKMTDEDLRSWQEETSGSVKIRRWPGGHFYLWEQSAAVLGAVADRLRTTAR